MMLDAVCNKSPFVILSCGMLMSLGWAINGMIGNAPGATIPGVFIAFAVAGILGITREKEWRGEPVQLAVVRLAAFSAIGFWFGGEMTYGQMFGLTRANVADGQYYWWGILGTIVKGSAWQGFGAACLGLGLSANRYRRQEIALLMLVLTLGAVGGLYLFNRPWNESTQLGMVAFSFNPDDPERAPRTEYWGAMWAGLAMLLTYARFVKKDRITFRFGVYGSAGGALGFALGQIFQAYSWNHPAIALRPWLEWWKVMEMTFGFVGGCAIALAALKTKRTELSDDVKMLERPLPISEWLGISLWLFIMLAYFSRHPWGDTLGVFPFISGILVFAGLHSGRWWPWIVVGVMIPLSTGLITGTEVMMVYTRDTGWGMNGGEIVSLWSVVTGYAWPTIVLSVFVCTLPFALWMYRSPANTKAAWAIIRVFIIFQVASVMLQMVWGTLKWAPNKDFAACMAYAHSRSFPFLIVTYLFLLVVGMMWFPDRRNRDT